MFVTEVRMRKYTLINIYLIKIYILCYLPYCKKVFTILQSTDAEA